MAPPRFFQSSTDPHFVGDGSSSAPNSLVYQIGVVNEGAFTATGIEVSARIPRIGPGFSLACREIPASIPEVGDNPNIGSASCTPEGLTWTIGNLDAGTLARLFARVEAVSVGNHVSRVTLSADLLPRAVVRDEFTPVLPEPLE